MPRAKFLLQSSFLLAFLASCSSVETGTKDSSSTPSSGGSNAGSGGSDTSASGGSETGSGGNNPDTSSGGNDTSSSGGAGVDTGAGGTDTNGGSGGSDISEGTGGSDTNEGSGGSSSEPEVNVFLAGDNPDTNGPLQTTLVEDLPFDGGGHILVRPTTITTEPNTKHPVAIWGPGGGTPPGDYMLLLTRMASQGFVVVGIRESTGDSVLMSAAIDWLEEQNADDQSPMYDRLILDRVGVFGHSMGGLSSEAAALSDDRVSTALLNNSGAFSHDALVNVTIPTGIIYGESGQERPNAEGDYNNPGNQGPCWLSMMAGGGHGSGPWDGAGANVAWMRWHLGGENFRKDDFLGEGGDYNDTGIWATEFKNWDSWTNWNE